MTSQETSDRLAVKPPAGLRPDAEPHGAGTPKPHDHRLEHVIDRLPERWGAAIRWLRHPSARWARIPAGILFIIGGCLFILPILGLWMIPVGLFLLAEDVPVLHRLRRRVLDWIERSWPHWFAGNPAGIVVDASKTASKEGPL